LRRRRERPPTRAGRCAATARAQQPAEGNAGAEAECRQCKQDRASGANAGELSARGRQGRCRCGAEAKLEKPSEKGKAGAAASVETNKAQMGRRGEYGTAQPGRLGKDAGNLPAARGKAKEGAAAEVTARRQEAGGGSGQAADRQRAAAAATETGRPTRQEETAGEGRLQRSPRQQGLHAGRDQGLFWPRRRARGEAGGGGNGAGAGPTRIPARSAKAKARPRATARGGHGNGAARRRSRPAKQGGANARR